MSYTLKKQTLSVPQITILFVSSQYKTLELLPEIWTSLHEANTLMHLITFQLHEWSTVYLKSFEWEKFRRLLSYQNFGGKVS